jgi:erythromycin esterase
MKKLMLIILVALPLGCKNNIEKRIAGNVIEIEDVSNEISFVQITDFIKHKNIVILGEAGHGDGKTFEVKSRLVKYLIEQYGFNTLALEGVGFIDMEIKNNKYPIDSLLVFKDKESWIPWWGEAKQTAELIDFMKQNETLNYIGLESYSHTSLRDFLISNFKKHVQKMSDTAESTLGPEQRFEKVYDILYGHNPMSIALEDLGFYKLQLIEILNNLKDIDSSDNELLSQILENAITMAEIFKHYHLIGGFEGENIYVNIRDKQMASNLMWHRKRNPNAKILVWTANFHGAKNISDIRYKEENPNLYDSFTLFNDYLVKEYGDEVYSMAFISSKGEVQELHRDPIPIKIQTPASTLEFELDKKNIEYGYIDFLSLKQSHTNLQNKVFHSTILGYDNKPGKWLNVFDGVFYIRENEPVIPNNP